MVVNILFCSYLRILFALLLANDCSLQVVLKFVDLLLLFG